MNSYLGDGPLDICNSDSECLKCRKRLKVTYLGDAGSGQRCCFPQINPKNADALWGTAASWEFMEYPCI